jgi:hypothetical protein
VPTFSTGDLAFEHRPKLFGQDELGAVTQQLVDQTANLANPGKAAIRRCNDGQRLPGLVGT